MVIAIDGPAGSGKSTIAHLIAERLNFSYINSGRFYRALTLACSRAGLDFKDKKKVEELALKANLAWKDGKVYLEGELVDNILQTDLIDRYVADLSAILPIRHKVNDLIRSLAKGRNLVVEGRDMTTVVFPNADYAFYLDASAESRAKRRFEQGLSELSYKEILKGILKRDEIDRTKEEGSLKHAPHVEYLDSSHLTIEEVYARLVEKIQL